MITRINEQKPLTKHISCECKCRFDGTKYNADQWWNNDNVYVVLKRYVMKKVIFGILLNVVEKLKTFSMYYG